MSEEEDRRGEGKQIHQLLKANGYTDWVMRVPSGKKTTSERESKNTRKTRRMMIGLPYIKNTSEKLQRIFQKYDIQVFTNQ